MIDKRYGQLYFNEMLARLRGEEGMAGISAEDQQNIKDFFEIGDKLLAVLDEHKLPEGK